VGQSLLRISQPVSRFGCQQPETGVNAFALLIAGIALVHHATAIITADTDFIEIATYADIDVIRS
jgi:hypothetical protein